MTPKISYPKYIVKRGLAAALDRNRGNKPPDIRSAETILEALKADNAHAALYELEKLRKTLRKWTRENPPSVELVTGSIDITTTEL